jgi:glycerol-3-phosphate dehydrogenase subunit C
MEGLEGEMIANYHSAVKSCIDCGKCGEICPICKVSDNILYTPDNKIKLLSKIENGEELTKDEFDTIYLCTRCRACNEVCPVDIPIADIIQYERGLLAEQGREPEKTRHIIKNIVEKWNPKGLDNEKRKEWISDDLKFSDDSEIGYMAGCWVAFAHGEIARNTIRILNHCGIYPKILEKERCCGLFVIDNGHLNEAKEYAKNYVEYIESCGVKKLIVSCPACYSVLKFEYPKLYRKPSFEVVMSLGVFKELIESGRLKMNKINKVVSVRDGCPLRDRRDVPRYILRELGVNVVELFDEDVCCGAPAGVKPNYPEIADAVGMLTIKRAKEISEMLISYCPFCLYHLEWVREKYGADIIMKDLSTLLIESIS